MTRRRLKFRSPVTALVPLEATVQIDIVNKLRPLLPPDWRLTAFPAGGGGVQRGVRLKAMGLISGFPDLLLLHWCGRWHGLEVKRPGHAKRTSDAQDDWIEWAGGRIAVVTSVEEARAALQKWGVL